MANAAGKFWTHIEVEHVQGLDFTSLYAVNTGGMERERAPTP